MKVVAYYRVSTHKQGTAGLGIEAQKEAVARYIAETKATLIEEYIEKYANPYAAAERGYVDDVIDPAETRKKVIAGFRMLASKREELPRRKHGNTPL